MEEGVSDKKIDKSEKNDEEKEAECLDDTSPDPDDMEEGVNAINDNKNEKYDEEPRKTKQNILISPQLMKLKE